MLRAPEALALSAVSSENTVICGFRGSDCLVLLVVLVPRNGPAEFYNWQPAAA